MKIENRQALPLAVIWCCHLKLKKIGTSTTKALFNPKFIPLQLITHYTLTSARRLKSHPCSRQGHNNKIIDKNTIRHSTIVQSQHILKSSKKNIKLKYLPSSNFQIDSSIANTPAQSVAGYFICTEQASDIISLIDIGFKSHANHSRLPFNRASKLELTELC